jgi:hypothetical protein
MKEVDFIESGNGIELINPCPLEVDNYFDRIMIICGVASLDVL